MAQVGGFKIQFEEGSIPSSAGRVVRDVLERHRFLGSSSWVDSLCVDVKNDVLYIESSEISLHDFEDLSGKGTGIFHKICSALAESYPFSNFSGYSEYSNDVTGRIFGDDVKYSGGILKFGKYDRYAICSFCYSTLDVKGKAFGDIIECKSCGRKCIAGALSRSESSIEIL